MFPALLTNLKLVSVAYATVTLIAPFDSARTISSPTDYIDRLYFFAIGIGALLAMAIIIFGAIRYMAETGKPFMQSDAKTWIFSGVLGLIILIAGALILGTLNKDLTTLDDAGSLIARINRQAKEDAKALAAAAAAREAALTKSERIERDLLLDLKPWTDYINDMWNDPHWSDYLTVDPREIGYNINDEVRTNTFRQGKQKEAESIMANLIISQEAIYENKSEEDKKAWVKARDNILANDRATLLSTELGGVRGGVTYAYIRGRVGNRKDWVDAGDYFDLGFNNNGDNQAVHDLANQHAADLTQRGVIHETELADRYAQTLSDKLWEIRNRETIHDPNGNLVASQGRRTGFEKAVREILSPRADGTYKYGEQARKDIVAIYNNRANRYYGWATSIDINGNTNSEKATSYRTLTSEQ
jgi:hypothetical protein